MEDLIKIIIAQGRYTVCPDAAKAVISRVDLDVLMKHVYSHVLVCKKLTKNKVELPSVIKYECKKSLLVKVLSVTRRTVLRSETLLAKLGLISSIERCTESGRPNLFSLNIENVISFFNDPVTYYNDYQNRVPLRDILSPPNETTLPNISISNYNISKDNNTTYYKKPSVFNNSNVDPNPPTTKPNNIDRSALAAGLRNKYSKAKSKPLPLHQRTKELQESTVNVIKYWNNTGNLRPHNLKESPRGKYYFHEQHKYIQTLDTMLPDIMNGTFYTHFDDMDQLNVKSVKFTISHIKRAIDKYSRSCTYEYSRNPKKAAGIYLHEFFHRPSAQVYATKKDEQPSKYRFTFKFPFINCTLNEPVPLNQKEISKKSTTYPITVNRVISVLKQYHGYSESIQNYNQVVIQIEKAAKNIKGVANGSSDRIIARLPELLPNIMTPVHVDSLYKAVEFRLMPYLREIREIRA